MALLGACELATAPPNVFVTVSEAYTPTDDGCIATFNAEAIGTTRADWGDVQFLDGDQLVATYTGREFWGVDGISPGQEITSIPLQLEVREEVYPVHMVFFTGRQQHEFLFGLQCPTPGT